MRLNHSLSLKQIEDRIHEYEDMEEETSREYFSGHISLGRKILAIGYAEKEIASLKKQKEIIARGQPETLSDRLRELNRVRNIR